jgi:predicted RNA-binding Zn-ribbon protein involved in translation (DUF1610 family)
MRQFDCPACGETEEVSGRSTVDGIVLTCARCGHEWPRDDTPRCATCGGTEISRVARAVLAGGRATVMSVVGQQLVPVCADCDREAIEQYVEKGHPLPPSYLPAAARRRD